MTGTHSGIDGRRQRSARTHTQILDAAEELFATVGYHATSLRSIARAIDMTHAGVLGHFASKEALLVALLLRLEEQSHVVGEAAGFQQMTPAEQLLLAVDHIVANSNATRLFVTLIGEAIAPEHPGHEPLKQRFTSSLQGFEAAFGTDGERLLGGWLGLQLLWLYLPDRVDITSQLAEQIDHVMHPSPARVLPPAEVSAGWVDAGAPTSAPTRRDEIIAAALRLFTRTGYGATSVREIAASLGTSHGALRYYFPDKESLLRAVLEARDARDRGFPVDHPLDPLYGLYLRSAQSDQDREQIDLYLVLACEATDPGHPAHQYFRDRFAALVDNMAAELEKLKRLGLARSEVNAERSAIWALAQLDGLQLHAFYGGTANAAPAMLASLAETLLVSLPPAVAPTAA